MRRFPNEPIVVPSILAADPARVYEQVVDVVDASAQAIHVDVMDGRFVASHGFRLPERTVHAFAAAGADSITVHVEACSELLGTIDLIMTRGDAIAGERV